MRMLGWMSGIRSYRKTYVALIKNKPITILVRWSDSNKSNLLDNLIWLTFPIPWKILMSLIGDKLVTSLFVHLYFLIQTNLDYETSIHVWLEVLNKCESILQPI